MSDPTLDELSPEERARVLLDRMRAVSPAPPQANGQAAQDPPGPAPLPFDADLIPDVETTYQKSAEDLKLDAVIDSIDIIDAYRRWIGKMDPDTSGRRTEGIKISCPMPNHPDHDPSAWINTENQLWYCGGCAVGGDKFDLAAIHFGYDIHGYKTKENFPQLRKLMAQDYGYFVVNVAGRETLVEVEPEPEPAPEPPPAPAVAVPPAPPQVQESPQPELPSTPVVPAEEPLAPVIKLVHSQADDSDDEITYDNATDLFIPWEKIIPVETFLHQWMQDCTIDDLPHEFYFFLGLQALGFVAGGNNLLADYQPVKGNLFTCLYGRTGVGKSRAIAPFQRLMGEVFPFDDTDFHDDPKGVKILPQPGSAEALIDSFTFQVLDPSTNAPIPQRGQIAGWVRWEELSSLISKAVYKGSTIKETFIQMYDVYGDYVTTHSRKSGVARAYNPFCQLTSTTQPNAVHAFLSKTDVESGFLNRLIFAAGRGRKRPIAYGSVQQDIEESTKLLRQAVAWAQTGHMFVLQGDALDAWSSFFEQRIAPFKAGDEDQDSIFSRVDLTLKKFILLMTVNAKLDQPTGEIVEQALALYPYLKTTYSIFNADIIFDESTSAQTRILNFIKGWKKPDKVGPTTSDIVQQFKKSFPLELIKKTIQLLQDLNLIDPVVNPGRGPKTPRFKCVGFDQD